MDPRAELNEKWAQFLDWAWHHMTIMVLIAIAALAYLAWTFRR